LQVTAAFGFISQGLLWRT